MSLAFECPCGRRYHVGEELAGKVVRCKQCGEKIRIPNATSSGPDLDLYGLDEGEPAPSVTIPRAGSPRIDPRAAKDKQEATGKRPLLVRRFLKVMPRGDDLRLPMIGAVGLVVAVVSLFIGGLIAQSVFVFVALAATITLIIAGITALITSFQGGIDRFLPMLVAVGSTSALFRSIWTPHPNAAVITGCLVMAVAAYLAFLFREKQADLYRWSLAVGMMGTLLFVAFMAMLSVVRTRLAGPEMEDLAVAAPPVQRGAPSAPSTPPSANLTEARRGFQTKTVRRGSDREPIVAAPPSLFETIRFPSPVGPLGAYLTPDPGDGVKHPAIVWITGGDCNSIGDVWTPAQPSNDQTAAAYRMAGIIMMFPSLRGGNDNPGEKEGFLGEVDDILAATDYLAKRPYVDPTRIYLGGHSTGGTLVLLVAESTDRFRAVFSFGPVDIVRGYGPEFLPFDTSNPREIRLRSPGYWLGSVRCPTYVLEGLNDGNMSSLRSMRDASTNPLLQFYPMAGGTHFSILARTNRLLASKILGDNGPTPAIALTQDELNRNIGR